MYGEASPSPDPDGTLRELGRRAEQAVTDLQGRLDQWQAGSHDEIVRQIQVELRDRREQFFGR